MQAAAFEQNYVLKDTVHCVAVKFGKVNWITLLKRLIINMALLFQHTKRPFFRQPHLKEIHGSVLKTLTLDFSTFFRFGGKCVYAGTRICGYAGIRIRGYADIWVCGYAGMRICGYTDIRIWEYANVAN